MFEILFYTFMSIEKFHLYNILSLIMIAILQLWKGNIIPVPTI